MIRGRALVMSALFVTVCLSALGCAHRGQGGGTAPAPTPQPMAHVEVHGVISFAQDVAVTQCYLGRPGTRLLNGYSVTFEGDAAIESGEVLVPEFTGDGTYTEDEKKRTSESPGWVVLNIARGPGFPHGTTLEDQPNSHVTVTISSGGKSGIARFENYRSLYGRGGDERGGQVSGSISWMCAQVERPSQ